MKAQPVSLSDLDIFAQYAFRMAITEELARVPGDTPAEVPFARAMARVQAFLAVAGTPVTPASKTTRDSGV